MTKELALAEIEQELIAARQAGERSNEGMVRVCARRAAGLAIGLWLETQQGSNKPVDAMSRLKLVQSDDAFPQPIREAARRLTTKVTPEFISPFSTHPVDDATIIINYFLERT
ncbi:hypothetical protein FBQ87_01885 [Sphingobacteriales bacterium CHB3]|nr:hypothetical protein [Sphingobacteriales bacterium CHB3]